MKSKQKEWHSATKPLISKEQAFRFFLQHMTKNWKNLQRIYRKHLLNNEYIPSTSGRNTISIAATLRK
jgi:hypothetical protein